MNAKTQLRWAALAAIFVAVAAGNSQAAAQPPVSANDGLIVFSVAEPAANDSAGKRLLRAVLGTPCQIYTAKTDGSGKKQLTIEGNNITPSWTPDGKRIIFASERGDVREIYFISADGSGLIQLKTPVPGRKLTPSMSHDLSRIAFAAESPASGQPEIWTVNADGTGARQLTQTPKAASGPTWSLFPRFSPDDSKILYASTRSGSSQIWVMSSDGSGQRPLTRGLAPDAPDANAPNWSPDGRRITFWAGYETKYGEIWMMGADGSNPKRLTSQPAPISSDNPAWSRDGEQIIFDTNRSRVGVEIWIMDSDGDRQRKLIGDLGNRSGVMQMSWRP